MQVKSVGIFLGAAALSLFAASYRFYDSAHTIGIIKVGGGEARHPIVLDPGLDRYTVIATATVIPPYRGDIRVAVEGLPGMDYTIHNSDPAVDLSPWRHPTFRDNTLYDVQPKDRLALWVVMQPKTSQPPPDLTSAAAEAAAAAGSCCFTGTAGDDKPTRGKSTAPQPEHGVQRFLAFYDVKSGKKLLGIPITFRGEGGAHDVTH